VEVRLPHPGPKVVGPFAFPQATVTTAAGLARTDSRSGEPGRYICVAGSKRERADLQYYLAIWSLLFGLVIGSFLNVVIYRVPRRESLVRPGSHCPGCGMAIRWYDNIPLASWLLLRGRCRSCRARIAFRYPLVEAITGAAFLAAYWRFGLSATLLLAWAFIAIVVTLAFINHDHSVIPNRIVFPAVACGLAASIALDRPHWWHYVVGCLGAGLFALLVSFVRPGITRFSEVKMALLLGAVLGPYVLVALPAAALVGMFAGMSLLFREKYRLRARTVFVPYLAAGAVMAMCFGQIAFHLYARV
jgi:leader peptidase (prepilin peptidase)/N-methyltransferase